MCHIIYLNVQTVNHDASFAMHLFIAHLRPLLKYAASVWNKDYVEDTCSLESDQRCWAKQTQDMSQLSYSQRLKDLDLYSMQGRLIQHDFLNFGTSS